MVGLDISVHTNLFDVLCLHTIIQKFGSVMHNCGWVWSWSKDKASLPSEVGGDCLFVSLVLCLFQIVWCWMYAQLHLHSGDKES